MMNAKKPPSVIDSIVPGDCVSVLGERVPDNYVDLVITSPPYDNLRDYDGYLLDVESLIDELYRVVKPGGIVVWVVGDSVKKGSETCTSFIQALTFRDAGFNLHDTMIYQKNTSSFPAKKDGNRYTQIFEYMFVFSKGKPKTANLICDKKNKWVGYKNWGKKTHRDKKGNLVQTKDIKPVPPTSPRNNIWKYSVGGGCGQSDKRAYKHPATFPEKLVEDHILTWSNKGDLVLDPMCGSGTTCKIAKQHERHYIGIDISKEYCKLAKMRIDNINLTS